MVAPLKILTMYRLRQTRLKSRQLRLQAALSVSPSSTRPCSSGRAGGVSSPSPTRRRPSQGAASTASTKPRALSTGSTRGRSAR
eukprot:12472746-Alexandrium_andersonii.AAC.1